MREFKLCVRTLVKRYHRARKWKRQWVFP